MKHPCNSKYPVKIFLGERSCSRDCTGSGRGHYMHYEREWNISFKKEYMYSLKASEHMQNSTHASWKQYFVWYLDQHACIIMVLLSYVVTLYTQII